MNKTFNIDGLVRDNIQNLKPYSSARDEYTAKKTDMVFLDANENPFNTDVNRYPDPQQTDLKKLIATKRGVIPSQLLLGNGSDEVLDLLFRAFCEPNRDNVLTLPPTYGMYGVLAGINAVENRQILLHSDFSLDVENILAAQDSNTKLVFVCSPNNPTGNIFQQEAIINLLQNFKGLVVIDEAYIDFAERDSWVKYLSQYPNLVVTQTLSKAHGMAGIRLGMCFASAEIIAILNRIKPPYNINVLTQQRAISALNKENHKSHISLILNEKKRLSKALLQVYFVEKVYPSEANFLLVKVDDAEKRYLQLLKLGIVVRNRSSQPLCANTLRITIGTENENQRLVQALKTIQL